jgi:hypothetical protein
VKHPDARRARRYRVKWPARLRAVAAIEWHTVQVVNLSVTGVLLQTQHEYEIGERVEVEIDFLTQPQRKTVVAGVGWVVREEPTDPRRAAIQFDLGCQRQLAATWTTARAARAALP